MLEEGQLDLIAVIGGFLAVFGWLGVIGMVLSVMAGCGILV